MICIAMKRKAEGESFLLQLFFRYAVKTAASLLLSFCMTELISA